MATTETSNVLRLTFLSVIVIGLFVALFSRLWFLQVLAGDRYVALADTNQFRTVVTEAPRGGILAAGGEELVKNRPALTLSAERQVLLDHDGEPRDEEAELVLDRLAALLDTDRDEVLERLTSRRYSPFRAVPIAIDVAPEIVFAVRENQELFPGVVAETLPVRTYPYGGLAAHIIGYTGEISDLELADPDFVDYLGGDLVGRGGLEEVYEPDLRGDKGQRTLIVNAQNAVLDVYSEREPQQGNDLVTTIELDLQRAVEQILEDGVIASRDIERDDGQLLPSTGASAVVMDVRDGSIRAMASYPSFDPSEFVGGVSSDYWEFVNDPDNHTPLFNRPIASPHPPGSVFKIVSGAAMVESGQIGPRGTVECAPVFEVGELEFQNWNRGVHEGPVDLSTALMRSCDTYFYELSYNQWRNEQQQVAELDVDVLEDGDLDEALHHMARKFGLGQRLGVDLPGESAGYIPSRVSKQQRWLERRELWCSQADAAEPGSYGQLVAQDNCLYGGNWRGGDAVNTSIGQGEIQTTPLQMAAAYMAIANGGTVYRPHVGKAVLDPDGEVDRDIEPEVVAELDFGDELLAAIRDGLERVVMSDRGTAFGAFDGFPLDEIPVAGKTGTAEQRPKVPFAWFVAYAPADDPEVVVVVNVEEGGGGSQTAAPIVRNVLEHLYGITPAEESEFQPGDAIFD